MLKHGGHEIKKNNLKKLKEEVFSVAHCEVMRFLFQMT